MVALKHAGIPEGAKGVFRGDGAFDGTALQATQAAWGWSSVCRTAWHDGDMGGRDLSP